MYACDPSEVIIHIQISKQKIVPVPNLSHPACEWNARG